MIDEPKLTDIVQIIKDSIKEIQQIADKKSVAINILLEKDVIFQTMIDSKRLREVIENLLSNAVKYNLEFGKIIVEIKKLDEHLEIKVKDTGMGIPQQDQARVYSKFFRAANAVHSETEGTGLGLFVVKLYVEEWGGKVSFTSAEEKGTTFVITLPLKEK